MELPSEKVKIAMRKVERKKPEELRDWNEVDKVVEQMNAEFESERKTYNAALTQIYASLEAAGVPLIPIHVDPTE